jgi:Protein of unknown function (DUF4054)
VATPNWNNFLNECWGWPSEFYGGGLSGAINLVIGTNPPYTLQDFIAMYPKFGGVPVVLTTVTITEGSPTVAVAATTVLAAGNPVAGAGIPDGAVILAIPDGTHLTLSLNATATGSITLTAWNAPPIPFVVVAAYLALASASLVQARWLEMWTVAMGLYIAHFLTLYARSDGNPTSNVGQIAAQGIATGIQVAKAAGDLSVSYKPVDGLENWGAWNLTSYGQQLATFAKMVGSGPMLLY